MEVQLNELWKSLHLSSLFHPYLASLFFLPFLLLIIVRSKSRSSNSKLSLPPSPPRLPLIGNLHQLGTLPHRSLQALSQKHGPLMFLNLGQTPTLVVSSADMVKEMNKNHDIALSSRPQTTAANILLFGCKDVGFAPYGEYWRQARKICVLELLSVKRTHDFHFVRENEVEELINRIRKASVGGSSINMSQMLIATFNNVVSRCVVGKRFMGDDGRSKVGELARRLMTQLTEFCVGDFFPSLKWIDVLRGFIRSLNQTFQGFNDCFDQVIGEHKSALRNEDGSQSIDFVDILLQLQKDKTIDWEFTQNDIKGLLVDMFLGGTDTTATGMEWLMAELIRNPNVLKKAQEEVRKVVGKKGKIDSEDLNQMSYLKCVVKENLRLHPPLPLLVPRQIDTDIEVGGYQIPAKTQVFVNAWAIHRDPKFWEDPEEFVPERFENSSVDYKGQDFQFIPFGTGRRGCPGIGFGILAMEYVLANLLFWFDWKLPGGNDHDQLDMSEAYGLTVSKKVPLHLQPIPYFP